MSGCLFEDNISPIYASQFDKWKIEHSYIYACLKMLEVRLFNTNIDLLMQDLDSNKLESTSLEIELACKIRDRRPLFTYELNILIYKLESCRGLEQKEPDCD